MKRIFKITALAVLFIAAFATSANAQQPYKGEFEAHENEGFDYYLTLDPYSNSIPTEGLVVLRNGDYQILKDTQKFKCAGTLEMSAQDFHALYNILSFEEEDDMPPAFMMIEQYSISPYDEENGLIYVALTPGANSNTFTLSDSRDVDYPLFTDLKFKRVK